MATKDKERYGIELNVNFKRNLETLARDQNIDLATIFRTSSDMMLKGYLPVLGKIPCGPLEEAVASTPEFMVCPPMLRPRADLGDYLLEADGDSNLPRIQRKDLVLMRPGIEAGNGEICAIQITGDDGVCRSTLKKTFFHFAEKEVELRPINPEYPTERYPADTIQIVGVFRGLIQING